MTATDRCPNCWHHHPAGPYQQPLCECLHAYRSPTALPSGPSEAYQLIAILAGELRAHTGHWMPEPGPLAHLVHHDRRMPDGACLTCAVLQEAAPWIAAIDDPDARHARAPRQLLTA